MSMDKMLKTLWQATHTKLSNEQLEALTCGEELALNIGNMGEVMDGIAALVANDTNTGNFQSQDDVPALLWGLSSALKAMGEAVYISSEAQSLLSARATGLLPDRSAQSEAGAAAHH